MAKIFEGSISRQDYIHFNNKSAIFFTDHFYSFKRFLVYAPRHLRSKDLPIPILLHAEPKPYAEAQHSP